MSQGTQVRHVPQRPPEVRQPRARMRAEPRKEERQAQLNAQQPSAQTAQAASRVKRPASLPFMVLISLLVLATAFAVIRLSVSQQRLDQLIKQRESEAQRLLLRKEEHWNARDNSGYLELIEKYAKANDLNPSFISAIIKCESSYRANAVSSVNARGLMQIMPDTGVWLAGRLNIQGYQPDSLFDPERNIAFGAHYLAYLSNMFSGSPVMVAAAYHAGANNVKHWALQHAADQKTITPEMIPMKDTRDYVGKVMDAYAIYYEKDQSVYPVSLNPLPDGVFSVSGKKQQ